MESSLLLNRMLALHIQLSRHLVAIVSEKIVIERLHIAGNTTSDACGVGGENSPHLRQLVVDVKQSESCHPLIGMIDDLVLRRKSKIIVTLNY